MHPYTNDNNLLIKRIKSQYNIPVIVDVDDALDSLTVDHPGYQSFKGNKTTDCIYFADHFVTSTSYLKMHFGQLNKNITVIENVVDPKRYEGINHDTKPYHAGFIVGWTGSNTHAPDLVNTGFIDGLAMAMREEDQIRAHFHVLCNQKLMDEFGARVVFNPDPVDFLDYPSMCFTYPFDLCAVPLYDSPFNDAKSDLRLLDMAPFKIPVLASPRDQFLRHAHLDTVLLTRDDSALAWRDGILEAFQNTLHRRQLAENANQYVLSQRTAQQGAEKWDQVLSALLEK